MKPLTKTQFLVLIALLRYPMHPYAIRQEIMLQTSDLACFSKNTIRKALDNLLAASLIEECHSNSNVWLRARRGVPYELTDLGQKRLRRELSMYHEIIVKSYAQLNQFDS